MLFGSLVQSDDHSSIVPDGTNWRRSGRVPKNTESIGRKTRLSMVRSHAMSTNRLVLNLRHVQHAQPNSARNNDGLLTRNSTICTTCNSQALSRSLRSSVLAGRRASRALPSTPLGTSAGTAVRSGGRCHQKPLARSACCCGCGCGCGGCDSIRCNVCPHYPTTRYKS